MRVLVCGGRNFNDRQWAFDELDRLHPLDGELVIITGGANGADSLARDWFLARLDARPGLDIETFPADWKHLGKAAGPLRNQKMIDVGKPDLVVAFPGGRGTADMVRRAREAGIPINEIH